MKEEELEIATKNDDDFDEEPEDPRAHRKLLQAVSSLGKVQHIQRATRSESQRQPDEFHLVKNAYTSEERAVSTPAHAVGISDIVRVLKDKGKHIQVGKNLKNVATTTKVVPVPLEKPVAERIKRSIGYDGIKKKLARWDAIVAKNRSSETQVFPLAAETVYINTSAHAKPLKLAVKSDLVREMEATEAKLAALRRERQGGDMRDPKDIEAEEDRQLKIKLTRDELIARRKELAYLKMRQSQKSAKARLQNKIKSKKYHKLLKRQKMQQQIKDFEQLQKTNPEAALEKLNQLEKNRVLERANLRHKNTGTWAKSRLIRAKYDKDVRKDLSEQLEISKQLTQKNQDSDEEEEDVVEVEETVNNSNEISAQKDAFNPWMIQQNTDSKKSNTRKDEEGVNYRKYWLERNERAKQLEEYMKEDPKKNEEDTEEAKESISKPESKLKLKQKPKKKPRKWLENGWIVEEVTGTENRVEPIDIDEIFDAEEDRQREEVDKKLQKLTKVVERLGKVKDRRKHQITKSREKDELKQLNDLTFKETAKRPLVDEALNAEEQPEEERGKRLKEIAASTEKTVTSDSSAAAATSQSADVIDPTQIAPIKLKQSAKALGAIEAAEYDEDGDDDVVESQLTEQQMTISQAFVDDDIVADFSAEKSDKSKLPDVELQLSMPGWGSWAGAGISQEAQARRNKRLILKLAPEEKRRDEKKSAVYINEEPSKKLRSHLVSDLPFPFTSLKDYEASIRAPIGRNFVPETAFRLLTRPAVIARKGTVIEPMDESELVKPPTKPRNPVEKRIMASAVH